MEGSWEPLELLKGGGLVSEGGSLGSRGCRRGQLTSVGLAVPLEASSPKCLL